jgi:CDP-6-deoxy-D-xylo-4-hexulose-3-dehydrase
MWKLAEDTITKDEIRALAEWLLGFPRLTQGEEVRRLEDAWSSWLGVRESVLVGSGSAANLALVAAASERVERRPARIGVSAVTWSTNVVPSLLLGQEIVVLDVDPHTLGLRADLACEVMERGEVDLLFVTHLLGFDALHDEVLEVADRTGTILLEDACESHGARHGDRKVGTLGLGSTFSFYWGHHMSIVEGGMVSTDDADLADRVRLLRSHGLARESRRYEEHVAAHPDVDPAFLFVAPGLNLRSSDLCAFLGHRQLALLDERIERRNRNLRRLLEGAPGWLRTDYRLDGVSSFALPLVAADAGGAARVRSVLARTGLESRPVVAGNLLRQPFLEGRAVRVAGTGTTPAADHLHDHGRYVGNGHHVTDDHVDRLLEELARETP